MRGTLVGLMAALLLIVVSSCEKGLEAPRFENPLDPGYDGPELPVAPVISSCSVGNRLVVLSWTLSDTTGVGSYHVYRASGSFQDYSLVSSTEENTWRDETVSNGVTYRYRVCAVTRDAREGRRSDPIECTPAPFSVTIENGKRYVSSRNVSLGFSAASGTRSVMVSNSSLFSEASWQPYLSPLSWQLETGDGQKIVWAKFLDEFGLESVPVADSVVLDTRAFISSLNWSPTDSVLSPGAIIHIRLDGGETGGRAWVEIGSVIDTIALFDDGTHGDDAPDDGIYEAVYALPPNLEFYKEVVLGQFSDEAGNSAPALVAPRLMTVASAPAAVVIVSGNVRTVAPATFVELTWTQNNDADFASYRVYRDPTSVTLSSLMLGAISGRSETYFADSTVVSGRQYRYKVYVVDELGLTTGSNEKSVSVP
ncbi:MAG: hypothetical protein NTX17_00310 [Candidatus Eisenbacteria bacterium]|nr:hypothetical protein [Candidatus Eisenbacteria bacterium]